MSNFNNTNITNITVKTSKNYKTILATPVLFNYSSCVFLLLQYNLKLAFFLFLIKQLNFFSFINFFLHNKIILVSSIKNLIDQPKNNKKNQKQKTLFLLKLKRNLFFFNKLTLSYKIYFLKNKYHFATKYKLNKFFILNKLQKKIKSIPYSLINNKSIFQHFFKNLTILNQNWFFLIGNLISPFHWNLQNFKIKNSAPLLTLKKNNRNQKIFNRITNLNLKTFYKKTILNKFKYFKKINFNSEILFNLFYFLKFQTNKKINKLHKPYLFFYNNEIFKSSITLEKTMYNIFKNHSKIFNFIKKINFKNKNLTHFKFRRLSINIKNNSFYLVKNNNWNLISKSTNFFFRTTIGRILFFNFKIKNINFKNFKNYQFLKFSKNTFNRKLKIYIKKNNFFLRNAFEKTQNNSLFFNKFFKIKTVSVFSHFKNKYFKLKLFKLKKLFLRNLFSFSNKINKSKTLFIKTLKTNKTSINYLTINNLKLLKLKKINNSTNKLSGGAFSFLKLMNFWINDTINSPTLSILKKFQSTFKNNIQNDNNIQTINSNFKINLHLHTIKTKTKLPALLPVDGFLLTNDYFISNTDKKENIFLLKKSIYAFSYKNDMQKYILKRYLKNKFILLSQINTRFAGLNDFILQFSEALFS